MLRPSRTGAGVAPVRPGVAQRQPAQVDGSDAGAGDRSRGLSSVPTLHHRCAVECRRRLALPAGGAARTRRAGDLRWHEFPQARDVLDRGGPPVLWGRGESRQWPSGGHRGAVDRAARLLAGGRALCARGVADRRRPRSGAASPGCPVAGEVAPSAHPAPAGARQRPHRHRRAGRCGVWRYRPVSGHVASVAAPLCGGDFLVADRVPGAAAPRAPAGRPAGAPAHPARPGGGRAGVHGGPGRQGAAAVAAHQLAQPPRRAPLDGPVCGPAGDPGPRLARPPARPRGVAAGRTRHGRDAADQILLRQPCRPPPPGRSLSDSRISGGPSSSRTKS